MARLAYECNEQIRSNLSDESSAMKPFACTSDKYCLYCCCNPQCCLLVQRKPPRHFWEAWYFWLGVALLVLFIISSVAVSNCTVKLDGQLPRRTSIRNIRLFFFFFLVFVVFLFLLFFLWPDDAASSPQNENSFFLPSPYRSFLYSRFQMGVTPINN